MAIDGVQRWYDEVKIYDCRKMKKGSDHKYYAMASYDNNILYVLFPLVQ